MLAADVLLAGLQGERVRAPAGVVGGDAHQPARHAPHQRLAHRHVADVRPTEGGRHAERLAVADADVEARLARAAPGPRTPAGRRCTSASAPTACAASASSASASSVPKNVGCWTSSPAWRSSSAARTSSTEVTSPRGAMTSTATARPAAKVRSTRSVSGCTAPLTAMRSRPVAWTASIIASAAAVAPSYREALATSMPGQRADHRLELEDRLERALRRLGLVRRVGGVELGAADGAAHDGRDEAAVHAGAEEVVEPAERVVARCQALHLGDEVLLAERRGQVHRRVAQRRGDGREQLGHAGCADHLEHCRPIGVAVGQVGHPRKYEEGSGASVAGRPAVDPVGSGRRLRIALQRVD